MPEMTDVERMVRLARMCAPTPDEILTGVADGDRPEALARAEPDPRVWDALRRLLGRNPDTAERKLFGHAWREQVLAYELRQRAGDDLVTVVDCETGMRAGYPSTLPCVAASGDDQLEVPEPPADRWITAGAALAAGVTDVFIEASGWFPELDYGDEHPWRRSHLEHGGGDHGTG